MYRALIESTHCPRICSSLQYIPNLGWSECYLKRARVNDQTALLEKYEMISFTMKTCEGERSILDPQMTWR